MADLAELGFVVRDEPLSRAEDKLDRLVPAADKAAKATDRFNKTAADSPSATGRMSAGLSNLTVVAARFATGIAAAFSINALASYADAWSDMQSRVGAAIKDMEAAPALMQRLVDVANASYSPLSQTVEIYGRNVAVLKDLGRSAAETADFTESLNHMLVITATRGERAASVQDALSKAMATGKLQADGLEMVLANGGRVAEALAKELGTTVSGLRALASEGKITGSVIANAIIKPLEDVRTEAGAMTATITDAFVILNNNITQAIGTFDKASGASSTVANAIIFLAENLNLVGAAIGGVSAVILTALTPALIGATGAMFGFTASLLANPLTAIAVVIGLVVTRLILLVQELGGVEGAFQAVQNTALDVWDRIISGGGALVAVLSGSALRIKAAFQTAFTEIQAAFVGMIQSMGPAGEWLGFNAENMAKTVATMRSDADALNAAADEAFANSSRLWDRAMTGRQMDVIGTGADWKTFNTTFSETAETAGAVSAGMTSVGTSAKAANDNVKGLSDSTSWLTQRQKELNETYQFGQSVVGSFFSDFKNELKNGSSLWEAFGQAAINALDSIADRALSMAANGIWDMIFRGLTGGGFGTIGVGGVTAPVTGGFIPGLTGPNLFADGGYTGNMSPSAAAGIVHGQEFVMNADATRRIGVGTLQALNDNMPMPSNDNGTLSVQFNPTYQISGLGLTMEELQEVLARNNEQMMDELPDRLNSYNIDRRKRVVRS